MNLQFNKILHIFFLEIKIEKNYFQYKKFNY